MDLDQPGWEFNESMSATRDPSQPVTFVYSNLHEIYRKGLDAARASAVPAAPSSEEGAPVHREHPRFGERAVGDSRLGWAARSETYRVIKPEHIRNDDPGSAKKNRISLRSSTRVIKVGTRVLSSAALQTFKPLHFLRRSSDRLAEVSSRPSQRISPEIKLDLKLALEGQAAKGIPSVETRSEIRHGSELARSVKSLDRLQSRLHFLLREIQEFTGSGSSDSNSGEGT